MKFQLEGHGYQVSTFQSGEAVLEAPDLDADCLLIDLRMPGISGLELQSSMRRSRPELPIVFMTGHGDVPIAVKAMKDGAIDFLEKPFREETLLATLSRAVRLGQQTRGAEAVRQQLAQRYETLTMRERQVLALVVEGQSNKMIARALDISPRTVEVYRARVMEKMEVGSLAELVRVSLVLPLAEA